MIRMKRLFGLVALGIGGIVSGSLAIGQTVERDTTITGPRGRRSSARSRFSAGRARSIGRSRSNGREEPSIGRCKFSASPALETAAGRPVAASRLVSPARRGRQPAPAFGFGLMAAPMLNFSFGGGAVVRRRRRGAAGPGGPGPGGPAGWCRRSRLTRWP